MDTGVALGSPVLFAREIASGLLTRPFAQTVTLSKGYWIAWPEDRRRSRKIARFREWLLAEAAADPAIAAG